jgi:hypothetical protein
MPNTPPQLVADGNILPNRFLKASTNSFRCLQADGTAPIIGISGDGTKYPPQPEISNVYHAEQNDPVDVRAVGDIALLSIVVAVNMGELLTSDGNGQGVPAGTSASTAEFVGARALEAGIAQDLIRVEVLPMTYTPA